MKKAMSIRTYLILFCVAIVMISMLCQITFNLFFARTLSIHSAESRIEGLYQELVANYSDDESVINDIVATSLADENIKVLIISSEGIIFNGAPMQSAPHTVTLDSKLSEFIVQENNDLQILLSPEFPQTPEEEDTHDGFSSPSLPPRAETDQTTVRLVESFEYQGEQRTAVIWCSVIAIDSSVDLFTKSSIMVSCFVVLFGIIAVIVFSKRITKPISEIEAVAKHMANMEFDQQADEMSHFRELCGLAQSVNIMSDALSNMIDTLSADNASLSSQVEYQEKMEQMRRQFIANISHEMKTPLSMLMMYSESLRSNVPGIDRNYYCTTIIEEAAGLNTMVGQLLDISSIENGLSKLDPHELNFSELVQSVLSKMGILLSDRTVIQDVTPDISLIGDKKYLEQAMTNYLSNAVSHSISGGTIQVSLTRSGNMAQFSVQNDGAPISQEDLPRLWDSFYRGDKSRTQTGQKRIGLGLYIVKTIVHAHEGTVSVKNLDNGVEFSFQIPIA